MTTSYHVPADGRRASAALRSASRSTNSHGSEGFGRRTQALWLIGNSGPAAGGPDAALCLALRPCQANRLGLRTSYAPRLVLGHPRLQTPITNQHLEPLGEPRHSDSALLRCSVELLESLPVEPLGRLVGGTVCTIARLLRLRRECARIAGCRAGRGTGGSTTVLVDGACCLETQDTAPQPSSTKALETSLRTLAAP